jgi:hypothetical protein
MAVKHGRLSELWVADAGGTFKNWHQYLDKINHPQTVDNPETTVFGKTAKTRIVGLEDTKLSVSGPRDVAFETMAYEIKGSARAYKYFPAGSATGESQLFGTLLFGSYDPESGAEEANKCAVEMEVSDAVTRTVL